MFQLLVSGGTLVIAGVIGIPAFLASLSPAFQQRRKANWLPVGRLDDFPVATVQEAVMVAERVRWPRSFREKQVFVWRRQADDLVVFSRSCTDLGCPLDYDRGSGCFFCPCHGGIFDQAGNRLAGPPNRPLERYRHRVRDGILEVDEFSLPGA